MTLEPHVQSRLEFLLRVVSKEIMHLQYADQQIFGNSLQLSDIETLDQKPELALKLEAFASRFCRLQDTLGDKLLPALLRALGEPDKALLINLDKAEKFGWLVSTEKWVELRQLRNQMIHEYIEEAPVLHNALITAHQNIETLTYFAERLEKEVGAFLNRGE
ncbi:hypothetical protein OR573_12090 [Halomonas sp. CH40]